MILDFHLLDYCQEKKTLLVPVKIPNLKNPIGKKIGKLDGVFQFFWSEFSRRHRSSL